MDNVNRHFSGALAVMSGRIIESAKAAPYVTDICGDCCGTGKYEYFTGDGGRTRAEQNCQRCNVSGRVKVSLRSDRAAELLRRPRAQVMR